MALIPFTIKIHATQDRHVRGEGNSLYAISGTKYIVNWIFFPISF